MWYLLVEILRPFSLMHITEICGWICDSAWNYGFTFSRIRTRLSDVEGQKQSDALYIPVTRWHIDAREYTIVEISRTPTYAGTRRDRSQNSTTSCASGWKCQLPDTYLILDIFVIFRPLSLYTYTFNIRVNSIYAYIYIYLFAVYFIYRRFSAKLFS